jgi:hypothetical protein
MCYIMCDFNNLDEILHVPKKKQSKMIKISNIVNLKMLHALQGPIIAG